MMNQTFSVYFRFSIFARIGSVLVPMAQKAVKTSKKSFLGPKVDAQAFQN
jgi:hypothetical protein